MKPMLPALALAGCLAGLPLALSSPAAQDGAPQGQEQHAESALHTHMEKVEEGMKRLRRSVRNAAKREDALEDLAGIQTAALACKQETPSMAARVPEEERPAFLAGYRKKMIEFLDVSLELEVALIDGDVERAKELYGRLGAMEDEGHDVYVDDE